MCFSCKEKCDGFKELDYTELRLTSENKVYLHFRKGETIAKQGAFVTHILYLQSGMVKVYKEIDYKTNLIYDIFSSGKLLGLSSLFHSNQYQYSISAIEESDICAIDKKTI